MATFPAIAGFYHRFSQGPAPLQCLPQILAKVIALLARLCIRSPQMAFVNDSSQRDIALRRAGFVCRDRGQPEPQEKAAARKSSGFMWAFMWDRFKKSI
jgi:hypothetical protein